MDKVIDFVDGNRVTVSNNNLEVPGANVLISIWSGQVIELDRTDAETLIKALQDALAPTIHDI